VKSVRVFKELFNLDIIEFSVVSFSVEASNLHNCDLLRGRVFFFSFSGITLGRIRIPTWFHLLLPPTFLSGLMLTVC
jgi:hypothetical protein